MKQSRKHSLVSALLVAGVIINCPVVMADDDNIDNGVIEPCQYLPLANDFNNASVCVDVPVALKKVKVVFNLDHDARDAAGNPIGMRHMLMLAGVVKARIAAGLVDPNDVSIIGAFHGSAAPWVLSDAWWNKKNNNEAGNPFAPMLNQLLAMKDQGVNLQLEECGVTMRGNGWTNADVYPGVKVNQGAVGRIFALQQKKYAYIQPGK